jgi:hypothetical protein
MAVVTVQRHVLFRRWSLVYTVRMNSTQAADASINYDSGPLLELEIEGVEYRLDAGKHGTALCVSTRTAGTWDWQFLGEARWDGTDMRMRLLDRSITQRLSTALASAVEQLT